MKDSKPTKTRKKEDVVSSIATPSNNASLQKTDSEQTIKGTSSDVDSGSVALTTAKNSQSKKKKKRNLLRNSIVSTVALSGILGLGAWRAYDYPREVSTFKLQEGAQVIIDSPKYIAPGDKEEVKVTVVNGTDVGLKGILILPMKGLRITSGKTNTIEIDLKVRDQQISETLEVEMPQGGALIDFSRFNNPDIVTFSAELVTESNLGQAASQGSGSKTSQRVTEEIYTTPISGLHTIIQGLLTLGGGLGLLGAIGNWIQSSVFGSKGKRSSASSSEE